MVFQQTFTKYPDGVSSVEVLAPLGKSDHVVVLLELQIQIQEDKQLTSVNCSYQKTKSLEIVDVARTVNWILILSLTNVDGMWHMLKD